MWGIGPKTTAFLAKHGIRTALEFARQPEAWVKKRFPNRSINLAGAERHTSYCRSSAAQGDLRLHSEGEDVYASIEDRAFVFAQLAKNIENACIKARKYKLAAQRVLIFLRTQQFRDFGSEIDLSRPTLSE